MDHSPVRSNQRTHNHFLTTDNWDSFKKPTILEPRSYVFMFSTSAAALIVLAWTKENFASRPSIQIRILETFLAFSRYWKVRLQNRFSFFLNLCQDPSVLLPIPQTRKQEGKYHFLNQVSLFLERTPCVASRSENRLVSKGHSLGSHFGTPNIKRALQFANYCKRLLQLLRVASMGPSVVFNQRDT